MKTISSLPSIALLAVAAMLAADSDNPHAEHAKVVSPPKLVKVVRDATRQFLDVNAATASNYQPAFGCVSGPDHGAMGVHYINGTLVGDGEVDATKPEALIY